MTTTPPKKKAAAKPGRQPQDRKAKAAARPAAGKVKVALDPDDLSNRDILDYEDATGSDIFTVFRSMEDADDGELTADLTYRQALGLYWLVQRKAQPDLTWDQVLDQPLTKMSELEIEVVDGDPSGQAAGSSD